MPTANDLIVNAAKKLGIRQDEVTAQNAQDGLDIFNSMLDAWSINRIFVYQVKQENFTWPGSTTSRTIGSEGNFNTTRPFKLEEGTFFRDSNNNDFRVSVTTDRSVYDDISLKNTTSTYPELLFYYTEFPLGILFVYPVPSTALTLFLNSWKKLQSFAALTDVLSLPPGYQYAIENNLAIELESVFRMPVPDSVKVNAGTSKGYLASINSPSMEAHVELGMVLGHVPRSRDIYADGQ